MVVKSPHVPHHEMSEQEIMKDAMIKKQEGITFKRLSHSPDVSHFVSLSRWRDSSIARVEDDHG